mmetsp:Transcript_6362/g.10430  ORF Transcript_6362/g.10430 Transcript_6362/m.10430 type:complete len:89 (+) Transcript_6362:103-369(+)
MISRLLKLNTIEMMKMCMYATGPVAYTIYATNPEQIEINRQHLKKWYGIDCTQEAVEISEDDIQNMIRKKVEERDLKRSKSQNINSSE